MEIHWENKNGHFRKFAPTQSVFMRFWKCLHGTFSFLEWQIMHHPLFCVSALNCAHSHLGHKCPTIPQARDLTFRPLFTKMWKVHFEVPQKWGRSVKTASKSDKNWLSYIERYGARLRANFLRANRIGQQNEMYRKCQMFNKTLVSISGSCIRFSSAIRFFRWKFGAKRMKTDWVTAETVIFRVNIEFWKLVE